MTDEWTIDILKKWGFSSYEEVFKEHEIDKDSFFKLNNEHIRLLIPRFGPQAKFLNLWTSLVSSFKKIENTEFSKENETIETIDTIVAADGSLVVEDVLLENISVEEKFVDEKSSTAEAIQVEKLQSQEIEHSTEDSFYKNRKRTWISNDIKLHLERTSEGKSYFGLYDKQGFDNALRSDLAKYIVAAELANDPNKRITPDDFRRHSEQIIELFPTEIVDTWYIPRKKKIIGTNRAVQPKGKLYDQYTKLIGKLRRAELRNSNLQEEQDVNDSYDFNEACISETQLDNFQWLRRCLEPQSEATVKWKDTASVRLWKLRSTESRQKRGKQFISTITDYFNEFRVLRQPWGYILLEQDFNYLYPNYSMQLLSNWEKVVPKLKSLLKINIKSVTFEEETVKVLLAIPTLFSPTLVGKWRPTTADLSAGFLLHIKVLRDLEVQVERLKQKLFAAKKQLQPIPVIIGKNEANITESYVYIDNFPYKVESPLRAVDVCFKTYHALHASYPFQSRQPWLFLQQAIYQFKTEWDEHVPSVATLVNEYLHLTDD